MMLVLRPLLASKLLPRRGRSSIFAALYFLPVLALIHAVGGGLVYASFPYIVLIVSLVSSAFHFAFKLNQKAKALFIGCVKDSRSAVILIGHWLLHAFGILAITEIREPELHLPFLALIPVPALFYIATARFSNPENFISDSNRDGTTICHWCVKLMINKAKKKKKEKACIPVRACVWSHLEGCFSALSKTASESKGESKPKEAPRFMRTTKGCHDNQQSALKPTQTSTWYISCIRPWSIRSEYSNVHICSIQSIMLLLEHGRHTAAPLPKVVAS